VIEAHEDAFGRQYRLLLIPEEYPEEPYGCGQSPLLRIESQGYCYHAEHIQLGERPTDSDADTENAVRHWAAAPSNSGWRYFKKYLHAFHGVTTIETYHSGGCWYVTYDSAEWREHTWPAHLGYPAGKPDMSEWKAYCEGEVYGYRIEQKVHVCQDRRIHGGTSGFRAEASEYDEWETAGNNESWSLYGWEWAQEAARDAWKGFLEDVREKMSGTGHSGIENEEDGK
jgi:hypothetical protein